MKLIVAIVRPFTIDKIIAAFEAIENFPGMTVVDSEGFGQRLQTSSYDTLDPLRPNKRIEIACSDDLVDEIVDAIKSHAHTGKKGDGIVIVAPLERAMII